MSSFMPLEGALSYSSIEEAPTPSDTQRRGWLVTAEGVGSCGCSLQCGTSNNQQRLGGLVSDTTVIAYIDQEIEVDSFQGVFQV